MFNPNQSFTRIRNAEPSSDDLQQESAREADG